MSKHFTKIITNVSAIAAFILAASASAQSTFGVMTPVPAVINEGETFSVMLAGPNLPCGFVVQNVEIVDDVININASQTERVCPAVVTPFRTPVQIFKAGERAKAGIYKIYLINRSSAGADQTNKTVLAFALAPVRKPGAAEVFPETGNWNYERGGRYATSGSGVSFTLERQGSTFAAMSNFYTSKGDPVWYFQAGSIANGLHESEAVLVTGGQALFGAYKPPAQVSPFANISFEFKTPSQGTAWIAQSAGEGLLDGIKLMPISISRFNFGFGKTSEALKGNWVLVADSKGGSDTQWLSFAPVDLSSNVLSSYTSGEFKLNCTLDSTKPESLPTGCALLRGNLQVAALTQISFGKLRGVDPNGKELTIYRIE